MNVLHNGDSALVILAKRQIPKAVRANHARASKISLQAFASLPKSPGSEARISPSVFVSQHFHASGLMTHHFRKPPRFDRENHSLPQPVFAGCLIVKQLSLVNQRDFFKVVLFANACRIWGNARHEIGICPNRCKTNHFLPHMPVFRAAVG